MGRKEDLDRRFKALTGEQMIIMNGGATSKEIPAFETEEINAVNLMENHEIALGLKAINDEVKRTTSYVAHIIEENQLMIEALKDVATAERMDWHTQQKAIGTLHTIYTKRSERE